MKISMEKFQKIIYSFYIIFILITILFDNEIKKEINIFFLIVFTIILIIKSMDEWKSFILISLISYFNYSIVYYYYLSNLNTEFYSSLKSDNVMILGLEILTFFIANLNFFYKKKREENIKKLEVINKNKIISMLIIIFLIIIWIKGYSPPNIGQERGEISPMYEYSIILFIIYKKYSYSKKIWRYSIFILYFLFISKDLIYGGRITSIQLILVFFILYLSEKYKLKQILPYLVIIFFIFSFCGIFRGNKEWEYNIIRDITIQKIKTGFVLDTAVSAYFTSLTFLKIKFIISLEERIWHLKNLFLAIFLGGSRVRNSELALISYKYYPHSYGGIFPYHLYYYFSWLGCVISAKIYAFILIKIAKFKNYGKYLLIYIVVSIFRSYLYSPLALIRGSLIFSVIYLLFFGLSLILLYFRNKILKKY